MSDIFREVEEELRQDRARQLWRRYGKYVIAVVVLVVAATAGYQGWMAYDLERRSEDSEAFATALEQAANNDTAAAAQALAELAESGAAGYDTLAALQAARLRAESGDREGAVALWERVAESGVEQPLSDAARLLAVLHQIDDGDPATLTARLEPLAEAGRPFRPMALELLALVALRAGDQAAARRYYTAIADDLEAPNGPRTRATQMLSVLEGTGSE